MLGISILHHTRPTVKPATVGRAGAGGPARRGRQATSIDRGRARRIVAADVAADKDELPSPCQGEGPGLRVHSPLTTPNQYGTITSPYRPDPLHNHPMPGPKKTTNLRKTSTGTLSLPCGLARGRAAAGVGALPPLRSAAGSRSSRGRGLFLCVLCELCGTVQSWPSCPGPLPASAQGASSGRR